MSECWTFNVALLNLNLRRVHLRAVHAARARALPPGAQVEARKSQDCMMPEALLDPIVRAPALAPNTPACAHETHELRHRSTLWDRQGAGTLCANSLCSAWIPCSAVVPILVELPRICLSSLVNVCFPKCVDSLMQKRAVSPRVTEFTPPAKGLVGTKRRATASSILECPFQRGIPRPSPLFVP